MIKQMNDKNYVTKVEMNLHLENLSLKITQDLGVLLDDKFGEMSCRIDRANIERRDTTILSVTGFSWGDRNKIKDVIQYSHNKKINETNTKNTVKITLINYGIPLFLAGAVSWVISHWDEAGG